MSNQTPKLLDLLSDILGRYQKHSNNEYYWQCPFCSKRKLAINMVSGRWHCWVCGSAGYKILTLLKKLTISLKQQQELRELLTDDEISNFRTYDKDTVVELRMPSEYIPLWKSHPSYDFKYAVNYLRGRGITPIDIYRYRLGVCLEGEYANRIIIPSYDAKGALNYFVGRDFFGTNSYKYKNPVVSKNVVGFESLLNYNYPLILCEGVFDAISIKNNAVPLFGKTLPPKLFTAMLEHGVKDVCIVLDVDAQAWAMRMGQKIMNNGIRVYHAVPEKKDPGEMGFTKITENIAQAPILTYKSLIENKLTS